MSGTGESTTDFAGEEREFRIRLGEIRRIEAKCGAIGIGVVLQRLAKCTILLAKLSKIEALASGIDIYADDVREPIYQGLVGRGMTSQEATKLLKVEIDDRGVDGLLDNAPTALSVLLAAREVPEEDDLGEQPAGESPTTPPSPSTSGTSTEPAQQSA
jgi:hypothetical protein